MTNPTLKEHNPNSPHGQEKKEDSKNAAFAEKLPELENAIARLYIKTNTSGRNKFRAEWPEIAHYLFGETLIDYDNNGTQNIDHRIELEEHAMERRLNLKLKIAEIREKSVNAGMLDLEYVRGVIDLLSPKICAQIYKPSIIERLYPDAFKDQEEKEPKAQEDAQLSQAEKDILSNQDKPEELDTIQPIDTQAVSEPEQSTPQAISDQPQSAAEDIKHPAPDVQKPETVIEAKAEKSSEAPQQTVPTDAPAKEPFNPFAKEKIAEQPAPIETKEEAPAQSVVSDEKTEAKEPFNPFAKKETPEAKDDTRKENTPNKPFNPFAKPEASSEDQSTSQSNTFAPTPSETQSAAEPEPQATAEEAHEQNTEAVSTKPPKGYLRVQFALAHK